MKHIESHSKTLTILQLNDLHGYIEPHWEMVRDTGIWSFKKMGGLARIAELFRIVREKTSDSVIALDNGDTFHGTYVATSSKGQNLISLMNALEFDAMTVHWEFAYGPDGVQKIQKDLMYPILAINCFFKESGELFLQPYQIIVRNGLKIAVIGLACPIIDKTMPPSFSEGLRFSNGNKELPHWIQVVKKKELVDLVIVLSHLGFPQDIELVKEVSGIDILVSGHTHNRMNHAIVENGTIIFQSGCHGSFVGKLQFEVCNKKIKCFEHSLIPIDDSLIENIEMKKLVEAVIAPDRKKLDEIVGEVASPLHRYSMLSSPMDDLLLEAIATAANTDIAFSNGWRYGAPIPPGPVTVQDLWNIVPTNPILQTVEMTGSEILQMLEENLERTFAKNPYDQMGGYIKRMRGLVLYFKVENPKHHRIDRLFVGSELIMKERYYTVSFITAQGVPIKFGRARRKLNIDAVTSLQQLFKKRGRIVPSLIQTVYEI